MISDNSTVIIGGGHNGLVCAAYLAKAGRKVTVLEAAEQVGGAAATREFAPGFKASCAHLLYLLDAEISEELALESHGLTMAREGLKTIALAEDGQHLVVGADDLDGPGLGDGDRAAYREYRRFMSKFAGIIGGLHNQVPPRITQNRGDLMSLGKLALKIRMLGRDDMREFLRITGINIYDILKENFDNPLLKGALSLDAVLGTFSGPRSNNSVFTALHRMSGNNPGPAGEVSIPIGGLGAVTDALAAAAKGEDWVTTRHHAFGGAPGARRFRAHQPVRHPAQPVHQAGRLPPRHRHGGGDRHADPCSGRRQGGLRRPLPGAPERFLVAIR